MRGATVRHSLTCETDPVDARADHSVRLFAAASAYAAVGLAMLAVNAHEDAGRANGHVRTAADLLEGAVTLAAGFVFYLLLATCTLVWIATRGRRFGPSR